MFVFVSVVNVLVATMSLEHAVLGEWLTTNQFLLESLLKLLKLSNSALARRRNRLSINPLQLPEDSPSMIMLLQRHYLK